MGPRMDLMKNMLGQLLKLTQNNLFLNLLQILFVCVTVWYMIVAYIFNFNNATG